MLYYRFLWDYFIYFAILIGVNAISRLHGAPNKNPSCVQTHLLGSIGEKLAQIRNFTFLK